jgi:PAS domain S-box-containing protein
MVSCSTPITFAVPSSRMLGVLAVLARLAAVAVSAGAVAILIGWAAHVRWLTNPAHAFGPMKPATALMLLLLGLSLWFSIALPGATAASPPRSTAAKALALCSGAIAAGILIEEPADLDVGVDAFLLVPPARPTSATCVAVLLLGAALLAIDVRPRRCPKAAELLATAAGTIGWLALSGYVYGAIQLYSAAHVGRGMGFATSSAHVVLALGILAARPTSGAMASFTSPLVSGQVVRRMLLLAGSIPILGYLAVRLHSAGLYVAPGPAVVTAAGGTLAAVCITFGVGESLSATDAVRRSRERENREWRRFFDRATFGAVFAMADGTFGELNEAFARMHGYEVEELVRRPIVEVFPHHRLAELAEKMRIANERGWARWESEHVRKDGSVFPVTIDLSTVRDEDGRLLYHAAYVQDITEEKHAEGARSRLASLVQSADDAIVAKTIDGTVVAWNRAAERVFGYAAHEMIGRSISILVPDERRQEMERLRTRILDGEVVVGFETERIRKDGQRIPVALTLSPIRDAVGEIVGVSSIQRDITARRQFEREQQEWAAVVAHDLRQPTTTIRFAAAILAQGKGPDEQVAAARIGKASERLERMIGDLLDVSRVESHRLEVSSESVDLRAIFSEVIEQTPEVGCQQCRPHVDVDAATARADAGRVVQVLGNLLTNAQKYGNPGAPIEVRAERVNGMVRVSVTNEGPGIDRQEMSTLFARYSRTRAARGSRAPGLGLGLYISHGIVDAMGGELWVESVPGDKTHFRFTLPSTEETPRHVTDCVALPSDAAFLPAGRWV